MRTTTTKLLALGTAAALGLAACGGSDEDAAPAVSGEARPAEAAAAPAEGEAATEEEAPAADEAEPTIDDAASTLRAELTALLQEHVHLTALAVGAIAEEGEDGPGTQAAVAALDENAAALGTALGAVPAVDDPEAFVQVWRDHVASYVAYAAARAEEDEGAAADATAEAEELLQPMADFFEEISDEELSADELFGELETHLTMVTDAIDAHVAGDTEASGLWRDAALHLDGVAADLSAGIVAAHPDELAGDPLSVPAETRATLTSALVEHTYLTLLAADAAVAAGGAADDPAVQAAVTTVDGSADDLASAVSGVGGNDGRDAFLDAWRPFLTAATDYAVASASGDTAAADEARAAMDAAPDQLVGVLQETTAGNAPGDLADALRTHVTNLTGAIDAMVAGDPAAVTQARAAAQHATTLALGLAGALDAASAAETSPAEAEQDSGDATSGAATTDAGSTGGTTSGEATEGGTTGESGDAGSTGAATAGS